MNYAYVLRSKKNNQYYIGSTKNIDLRLKLHNSGRVHSTKFALPWEIFHVEKFYNIKDAIIRERQLKSWKSRKAIERLKINKIEDPRFQIESKIRMKSGKKHDRQN